MESNIQTIYKSVSKYAKGIHVIRRTEQYWSDPSQIQRYSTFQKEAIFLEQKLRNVRCAMNQAYRVTLTPAQKREVIDTIIYTPPSDPSQSDTQTLLILNNLQSDFVEYFEEFMSESIGQWGITKDKIYCCIQEDEVMKETECWWCGTYIAWHVVSLCDTWLTCGRGKMVTLLTCGNLMLRYVGTWLACGMTCGKEKRWWHDILNMC